MLKISENIQSSQNVLENLETGFKKNTTSDNNRELVSLRALVKDLESKLTVARTQKKAQLENVTVQFAKEFCLKKQQKMEQQLQMVEERARQKENELAQEKREQERAQRAKRRSQYHDQDNQEGALWEVPDASEESSDEYSDASDRTDDANSGHVSKSGSQTSVNPSTALVASGDGKTH